MLEIRDLTVRYGGILALDRISISVPQGETVILVGANGAGKSSLINAVIGMVPTATGSMMIGGVDLTKVAPALRASHGIGYSPEGRRVFPTMSVRDQQQIVAIARAMSASPKLLLLDEPFLGLAPVWIRQISDAIRQFGKTGVTVLMTEQMAVPALKVATRGYVMRSGTILREGPVAELRSAALAEEYL
jgi:branched-chain amino acid transport system ATP-binding protein